MSSRIIRGKSSEAATPLLFRPVQSLAQAAGQAGEPLAQTSCHSDAEWEVRVRAAYEQGLHEGRLAADSLVAARAQDLVKPAVDGFQALVGELANAKRRLRGEAEEDVVKLAMAISRRVLHRELATDPEALLGLVRAAWDRVDASETHQLRLSPEDAVVIEQHRAALNLPPRVNVTPDPALPRGSAFFDTSRGSLDASIATQLSEIERGLTDVLKRHKAGV